MSWDLPICTDRDLIDSKFFIPLRDTGPRFGASGSCSSTGRQTPFFVTGVLLLSGQGFAGIGS